MKRFFAILLSIIMIFVLSACAHNNLENRYENEELSTGLSSSDESVTGADSSDSENESSTYTNTVNSDTLVVYFSCTGNTAQVAYYISEAVGGDLFEIVPKMPYKVEDLNYSDSKSRSNVEANDKSSRPEFISVVSSWNSYKTIYLGYPIWYGDAPKIIYSFLDEYDCSGKTIIPFCTSGSTSISSSESRLKSNYPNANWKNGMRFSPSASEKDIANRIA